MTKGKNDPRPDPERSASARARKPPPNPWPRIKELEATVDSLRRVALDADRSAGWSKRISSALYALTIGQRDYINELTKPWWRRSSSKLAQHRAAIRKLEDNYSTTSSASALPPGNIQGLTNTRDPNAAQQAGS